MGLPEGGGGRLRGEGSGLGGVYVVIGGGGRRWLEWCFPKLQRCWTGGVHRSRGLPKVVKDEEVEMMKKMEMMVV